MATGEGPASHLKGLLRSPEPLESLGEIVTIWLQEGAARYCQRPFVHVLQAVLKHRSIGFVEYVVTDVDQAVG